MSKQIITVPQYSLAGIINEDGLLSITPEAIQQKAKLLAESMLFARIENVETRDAAIKSQARINGAVKQAEEDRVSLKDNFYKMCCAIDATKKAYVEELVAESRRLGHIVGDFNEQQREKEAELERQRHAEARKLEEARLAAEREQQRLAEEEKKKQEAAAAKGKELTPAAQAKLLEQQLDAQEKQEAIEAEQRRQQQQAIEDAERARQQKATGGAQRYEIVIEVTDAKALLAAHPSCVKLVPDLVQIRWMINNQPDKLPLPGVTFTKTPVFGARGK